MRRFLKKHMYLWFALCAIPFQEIVFGVTLGGSSVRGSRVVLFAFSIVYGLVLYLLGSIVRNPKAARAIRAVLLALTAVPFLIWHFIYAQFRVLYDVETAFAGATDALGGFSGDIFRLIASANGALHIVLFFLPFLLYVFWGRRLDDGEPAQLKQWLAAAGCGCLLWAACLFFIRVNPSLERLYGSEYQFENAAASFGLCTGLRLDITHAGSGGQLFAQEADGGFILPETESSPVISTEPVVTPQEPERVTPDTETETAAEEVPVIDTSPNVLAIDFDALGEGASDALVEVDNYVRTLTPTNKNAYTGLFAGKNLIFITAEAFTAEVIDPELTPTLYRLATKGINFTDYYQPASAGTTGGEYANLMGMLPTDGGNSMKNTKTNHNYMTIASLLNDEGYYGKAYHNNDYTYYDRDQTHINLGYSDGYMGYGNGMEEYVSGCWPESDLEMLMGTLPTYIGNQPFDIYYMSVSGHSLYTKDNNAMTRKNWDKVENLDCSDTVKAYLAAQLELEAALAYLVEELENAGIADDTVICISADHFPYGLDVNEQDSYKYLSELYGYEVTNLLDRDHNRLILWSGCLEDDDPIVVSSPTFSPDILPTLCNLFGIAYDSRLLPGRDVLSDSEALIYNLCYDWKTDYGTYYAETGTFVPADDSVEIPDGYIDRIKQTVKNKINYSKKVLSLDYYAHIFPDKE